MILERLQGFADDIGATLRDYMVSTMISRADLASDRYRQLMGSLERVEASARHSLEADRIDAQTGLGLFIRNILSFGPRGREFAARRDELTSDVEHMLQRLRVVIATRAQPNLPVPDELQRLAQQWRQVAESAKTIEDRVPRLARVEGWSGQASSDYGTMVRQQIRATEELRPLPGIIAQTYMTCSNLNKAALSAVERQLRHTQLSGRMGDIIPRPFGLFPRAMHWRGVLTRLMPKLEEMMLSPVAGSRHVSSRLRQANESATVVREGWPTGTHGGTHPHRPGRGRALGHGRTSR